jgi:hypothetical protein
MSPLFDDLTTKEFKKCFRNGKIKITQPHFSLYHINSFLFGCHLETKENN